MMPPLPPQFLDRPLAHRARHDRRAGRIENSASAVARAIVEGWGIEIDVQLSSDGQAMVFHDDTLDRLTDATGPVRAQTAASLMQIPLTDSEETIPTLLDVLTQVAGTVPVLIEIKDQDGALGPDVGPLEEAVTRTIHGYPGPVALMSFNPESIATCARIAPDIPRGLVTDPFEEMFWPGVPATRREELTTIPDLARVGASFISHNRADLDSPRVQEVKATGMPILCWTVRSAEQEVEARQVADNITFEGYSPATGD
ncbi:MAG: glycerophosphodiester phosphodiesterase family protein [Pseudomonadota bacterium]